MNTLLFGSEGNLSRVLLDPLQIISTNLFTFDKLPASTFSSNRTHIQADLLSPGFIDQFNSLINDLNPNYPISIVYTPALDYPVSTSSYYQNQHNGRFSIDGHDVLKGFNLSCLILYDLISSLLSRGLEQSLTIISFDTIYSTYLPKWEYYGNGVKPLSYSLAKAPLHLILKAFATDYTRPSNTARSYTLKLGPVETSSLPSEFSSRFLSNSSSFSLVPQSEISSIVIYLLTNKPLSLSGGIIDMTCGYGM